MTASQPAAALSVPADLLADLERKLPDALGFRLADVDVVDPGVIHNNRLFRLRAADGRRAMAKLYLRDGRHRMEREFDALGFLRRRGVRRVPAPLARSDEHYYAVYSLEAGENRPASRWTEAEALAAAAVAVELDGIRPEEADVPLRPAFASAFSHAEGIGRIRSRLGLFARYLAGVEDRRALPAEIHDLCAAMDPVAEVERLIATATRGLSQAELEARVPPDRWRLDVGDYAPHNVLIRPPAHPDGTLCVLDLEYAGWDDPVAMTALFVTAEQSLDMPRPHLDALLRAYQDGVNLPPAERARMERVMALIHVAWCAVHLQLFVPDLIEKKRFASPNLDVSAHLQDQIGKFHRRLALARQNAERIA